MKNVSFKLLWSYLKEDKLSFFLWLFLVVTSYIPTFGSAFFFGLALEELVFLHFDKFLFYLMIWSGMYVLFYSILGVPRDILSYRLEMRFNKNVIKDLYHKVADLPAIAFEDIGVGEFINRMVTDPDRVMDLLSKLIQMICRSLVVLLVIYISFMSSWILGLEIVVFGFIMGFISYKFFPKIKKTQESIKKKSDQYVKEATENLTGIREIKALGIKQNIEKRMFKGIDSLYEDKRNIRLYEVFYRNINNFIYFALQFIILFSAGIMLVKGKISYALFIVIDNYIWRIDDVVESISDFGVSYNKIKVSLKRIDEIVNNRLYQDEQFGDINLDDCEGRVEFKEVYFRYKEDEDNTLRGLNLKLDPHKKIAIVGRSGNGKSTIFNLLLRYFDVNTGSIMIDDYNIKDLTEKSLRQNISVIRQNPFLFNLTILENFQLVKPDVKLEEVKRVCKLAYIDDYIESLPKKYDTIIGEGGVNLSGGQKQRLAIARTLLLNTKIVLFDEATSALDNESQEYIKKTIDNLVKDHTVIIVAHRLSTIIDADIIHVIDKGLLVGSGTHKKLLKECKEYSSLYSVESSNN